MFGNVPKSQTKFRSFTREADFGVTAWSQEVAAVQLPSSSAGSRSVALGTYSARLGPWHLALAITSIAWPTILKVEMRFLI